MRKRRLSSLSSTGDTIIEVLLAIAVVSAIMGAAFVSANKSLNGTRLSQERGEALKFVQAQADLLSAAAKDPAKADDVFNPALTTFYFNELSPDPLEPIAGSHPPQGPGGRYSVRIERDPGNLNYFTSRTTWQRSGANPGEPDEEVFIRYRVYKP